ncbi:MAG: putative Ig domain-containing protein [Pseudomonadota bacterium]
MITPTAMAQPHIDGQWSSVINWPHIPVSAANLPDGRILTWASNERNAFPAGPEYTHAATWNPETGQFAEIPHPAHDMFCAHLVMLESGEVFVNGGRNQANSPWTSTFDHTTSSWTPREDMNRGRWYPTTVAMPNDRVFTAIGSGGGQYPELWTAGQGWSSKNGINLNAPILDYNDHYERNWWPLLHLAPNGQIFHSGPTPVMHYIDPTGNGSISATGPQITGWYPKHGATVMYDEGLLLTAGGAIAGDNTASTDRVMAIDINGPTPQVSNVADMNHARKFPNAVMLPTGDVLMVGGNTSGNKFDDTGAVLNPEIWDPATGTWRDVAAQAVPRTYHSIALLMLDGRVLSAGGGLCGNCSANHPDGEIYSPDYLFNPDGSLAQRPQITAAPPAVGYGATFNLTATPGISLFSLIKMSATTHGVNTDQRFLRVPFNEVAAGEYELTSHSNPNVLTPGYYMLFAVNQAGVPSEAAVLQVVTSGLPQIVSPGNRLNNEGDHVALPVPASDPDGGTLTFSAAGLPAGLAIDPQTGVIAGTFAAEGSYAVQVFASDGDADANVSFTWDVLPAGAGSGEILREWWTNISGTALSALTGNADYPDNPDGWAIDSRFEAPTNWADNYGTRMRGYLHPTQSGQYRFWIASDDNGELWLSTDDSPGNASRIARVPGWSSSRQWDKYSEQESQWISLQAGQRYYIEALQKEGGGGDNLAVAWQTPAAGLAVIDGQYLSPLASQINTPPSLASPGAQLNNLGEALTVDLSGSDADGDDLTYGAAGLPTGLAINPASGIVSGTPTAGGSYQAWVIADDQNGGTARVDFTWVINRPPTLTNPGTQSGTAGESVGLTLTASDADGDELTFAANGLPGGVSVNAGSGALTGQLNQAGLYSVLATVSDGRGGTDQVSFAWQVNANPVLADPGDQQGTVGDAVLLDLNASDPDGDDLTFDASNLPPGLSLAPGSGRISGTLIAGGSYAVNVSVTDGNGGSDEQSLTFTVNTPPNLQNPGSQLTTIGASVSLQLVASDSDGDGLSFDATGLPPGLSIAAASGLISGSPSTAGVSSVTVEVFDGAGGAAEVVFTWVINAPPVLTPPANQTGVEGAAVALQLIASDPDGDTLSYGATGLPAGLALNSGTGAITGALASAGNYTTSVSVSDGRGGSAGATFSWVVEEPPPVNQPPVLINPGPQQAVEGDLIQLQLQASDPDDDPLTFAASGLPAGVTLNPTSGFMSGTLTAAGSGSATVVVDDGQGGTDVETFSWEIALPPNTPPVLANPGPQQGTVGESVGLALSASDDDGDALTFSASGLPDGLAINPETGVVSGTLLTGGEFPVVLQVEDSRGDTDTANLSWSVNQHPTLSTPPDQQHNLGADIRMLITASDPEGGALTYAANGLPPGLALNPASGEISGVLTQAGDFSVELSVGDDSGGQASGSMDWLVNTPPTLDPPEDQSGNLDEAVALALIGQDADGDLLQYQATGLPAGLELDPVTGVISGGLSAAGDYGVVATVSDSRGGIAEAAFDWFVNSPPELVAPGDQTAGAGQTVDLQLDATDADGGTLLFGTSGLPDGLELNPETGLIAGLVNEAGSFNVSVSVTDGQGGSDDAAFVWRVDPAAPIEIAAIVSPPQLVNTSITYTAVASGGPNLRYSWLFGDGTPATPADESPSVSYQFAGPGRYLVSLTVTDDAGQERSIQFGQAIHRPLTAGRPEASSSLMLDRVSDTLWNVNPDNHTVTVTELDSLAVAAEIAVGRAPRSLAADGAGNIWVTNKSDASLSVIDAATRQVVNTIALTPGARPWGVVYLAQTNQLLITLEGTGELLVLDPDTGAQADLRELGHGIRHLSVSADGDRVLVSRFITPPLPGEHTATPQVQTGEQRHGGEVIVLDGTTLTEIKTIVLRHSNRLDSEHTGRGIPNYLAAALISPDGSMAWVPSKQDNILRGSLRDGRPLTHDLSVRAVSSRINLNTLDEQFSARVDHDNASMASAAAFGRYGNYLFVALEGNRQIAIVDPYAGTELFRFATGRAPQGVAVSDDGHTLYVHNFMDRSITVHDIRSVVQQDVFDVPLKRTISTVANENLAAEILLGKQLFYDAADPRLTLQAYMSCASCHNDGGQDGRIWDFTGFGEGLRNTISLEGHGQGHGLLHWSANFDEIQDFEGQIRNFAGGTGLMSDDDYHSGTRSLPFGDPKAGLSEDLDALAAYLQSLTQFGNSPYRQDTGPEAALAKTGQTVFDLADCGSCHRGSAFTDSESALLHDVGTLSPHSGPVTGLDTPTLRGLWLTAPYLHDGSAATLEDAIASHKLGQQLTSADVAALAGYLKGLDDRASEATRAEAVFRNSFE